jgi:hypothetical protein
MNAWLITFVWTSATVAAGPFAAKNPQTNRPSAASTDSPHRSLSAIQVDARAALRAEASSRRSGPNAAEVIRLTELYREMAAHPKRDSSLVLKQLGLRLRSRLQKVRDHIERQVSRASRARNIGALPALRRPESTVLAQQLPVAGGAGPAPGGQPAGPRAGTPGGFDYGPDLVDLIQRTISPATWDINGGNGSVVYFSPLRVLVVSAPGTVHDQVGDVLGQLRAAP